MRLSVESVVEAKNDRVDALANVKCGRRNPSASLATECVAVEAKIHMVVLDLP